MSFPPGTEMFQFPGFASRTYGFSPGYRRSGGLPHSETHGSKPARGSPWLIAACCVLRRLSVPRHPPDALQTLDLICAYPKGKSHYSVCAARRRKPAEAPLPERIRQDASPTQPPVDPYGATDLSGRPRSQILFTCQRSHTRLGGYLCSLSRISSRRVIGGRGRSSFVTPPRSPGGGGRDRTDDLMLAKHALSRLSYAPRRREWWAREDLNFRPHAYQARALTN
jgi:hypothetical protein